ncbi:BTB/POZ domain protein [Heracleum sosnowskyi]|uniref:BTB/POZ domain protein n=1 Tax=Heracleum sosnowskyi TaxID=360622 RepID=A0AAD8IIW3_9APIA|nr:BTB/POZ domain protein [Heracleum sosnowskyi]
MASQLALRYGHSTKPKNFVTTMFMYTMNTTARTLMTVVQNSRTERWRAMACIKYMYMLITWMAFRVLRPVMDYFPFPLGPPATSRPYLLEGRFGIAPISSSFTSCPSSVPSMDMVLYEGYDAVPVQALGGALSQILSLLNNLPATSRKYQFAQTMADKIVDENVRDGHVELMQLNRMALASAFARTSNILYGSIKSCSQAEDNSSWTTRLVGSVFPLGSCIIKSLGTIFPLLGGGGSSMKQVALIGGVCEGHVVAEKHAQELLWLTNKMRLCGVVDEALVQWSVASGLASVALTANPRVQGFLVKISAILFGEIIRCNIDVAREVKFRLLAIWVPMFCYAENGIAYPILTGYEKAETEKIMDQLLSSMPVADQQIILTNWLQDFLISNSDWPNLQISYDRWCHTARKLIA